MNSVDIITYYFENDGDIPNNILPVVIYKNALQHVVNKDFELLFCQNGWSNNWHDILLTEDHFGRNRYYPYSTKRPPFWHRWATFKVLDIINKT